MPSCLILCPTHDHADTLYASIGSVQGQSVTDWEMVVLCDGSPPRTFEVLAELEADDHRISHISFQKSVRFGEDHRDSVIRNSSAEIVMQLSDDDLWLPNHMEVMLPHLDEADWANQAPIRISTDSDIEWWPINHSTRHMIRSITDGVPLSAGPNFVAYRKDAYLRLPEGWTCAPASAGPSDAFMWAKFFRDGALRAASSARSTALKFPSWVPQNIDLSPLERLENLRSWLPKLGSSDLERDVQKRASVLDRLLRLFAIHGIGKSLRDSFARAGLRAVSADSSAGIALNGSPMDLPLTERQNFEAQLAHDFLRAGECGLATASSDIMNAIGASPKKWLHRAGAVKKLVARELGRELVLFVREVIHDR